MALRISMGSRRKRSGAFERGGLVPLRQVRAYRVNFRDGNETTAYYTDDLEDAVNTAVAMARKRVFSSDCRADRTRDGRASPGDDCSP